MSSNDGTGLRELTRLKEIVAFLDGSAPLDGVWFGEVKPGRGGPYWWRTELREAMEALSAVAPPPMLEGWQPIESAPKDNKRPLYLARFNPDTGELVELDFDGIWQAESESWELPKVYHYWASAKGIEDPTHWAYQDAPIPAASPAAPAQPEGGDGLQELLDWWWQRLPNIDRRAAMLVEELLRGIGQVRRPAPAQPEGGEAVDDPAVNGFPGCTNVCCARPAPAPQASIVPMPPLNLLTVGGHIFTDSAQPQIASRSHGTMTTPDWIRNGPQPTNAADSAIQSQQGATGGATRAEAAESKLAALLDGIEGLEEEMFDRARECYHANDADALSAFASRLKALREKANG